MALPDTPLVLNYDPDAVTLDELCLFEPEGFTATGFRAFLRAHTNWTRAQIGGITVNEMKDVAQQLAEAIQQNAVPLVHSASLDGTRAEK